MWPELIYTLKGLGIAIGLILLYLGLFLYEDEQGKIQNSLEELWIRMDQQQHSLLARHFTFMQVVSRLVSAALNKMLGTNLLSLKSIGVSACFSNASTYLCVMLLIWRDPDVIFPTSFYGLMSLKALVSIALGLVPIFLARFNLLKIWFVVVLIGVLFWETIERFLIRDLLLDDFFVASQIATNIGVVMGVACDVVFIAVARKVLRWGFGQLSYSKLTGILTFNIVIGLASFGLPILYLRTTFLYLSTTFEFASSHDYELLLLSKVCHGMILSNLFIALFAIVFVLLTITVLAHRIFWPMLARPTYYLQNLGIARRSRLLSAIGALLIAAGVGGASWIEKIAEKLNPF